MISLINLNLEDNNIGDKGLEALVVKIQPHHSLTTLNFNDNYIGPQGLSALADLLKCGKLPTIIILNIDNNKEKYLRSKYYTSDNQYHSENQQWDKIQKEIQPKINDNKSLYLTFIKSSITNTLLPAELQKLILQYYLSNEDVGFYNKANPTDQITIEPAPSSLTLVRIFSELNKDNGTLHNIMDAMLSNNSNNLEIDTSIIGVSIDEAV
jgi:hypothetical protein